MKKPIGARLEVTKISRLESIQRYLRLEHFSDLVVMALGEFADRHPVPTNTDVEPDGSGPASPAAPAAGESGGEVVEFRPHPAAMVALDPVTGLPRLTRDVDSEPSLQKAA